jgi:hypothetical protein
MSGGIQSTNGTSRAATITSTTNTTSSDGSSALGVLPDPDVSGEIGMQLAMLMLKTEFERKTAAREDRTLAENSLAHAQSQELDDLREQADKKEAAAKEKAIGQIVGGAVEVGGAAASFANAEGVHSVKFDTKTVSWDPNAMKLASDSSKGIGEVANGIATFDVASKTRESDDAEIRAKADAMVESRQKTRVDDARDDKRAAEDAVGRILDWLKNMEETNAQIGKAGLGQSA